MTPSGFEPAGLWRGVSTNCATTCIGTKRTVMKYKYRIFSNLIRTRI